MPLSGDGSAASASPIAGSRGVLEKSLRSREATPDKRAQAALRSGDIDQALVHLREAREQNPELAPAEVLLAHLYLAGGKPGDARNILEQAAALFPSDPEPHLMFADLARHERRLSDAGVQYLRGRTLAANYDGTAARKQKLQVWALAGCGNVAETRRQLETAQKYYLQLHEIEPKHANALIRLGHVYFGLDRPDDALAQFRAAGAADESSPSAELTLASLYVNAGEPDQAQRWIEKAMDMGPKAAKPLLTAARFQLEIRNDPQESEKYLGQAAEAGAPSAEVLMLRALASWQRGELSTAERAFEELAFQQPDNPTVGAYLASVVAEQGGQDQLSRAWELLRMNAKSNPNSRDVAAAIGWVAFHLKNWEQAEKQLRVVAESAGSSRDAKYYYAKTLFRRGKIVAAGKVLEKAIDGQGLFIHLRDALQWQQELSMKK